MKKTIYGMSADELIHTENVQEKSFEPGRLAVKVLERALEKVMGKLGVDITKPIPEQQEALGIFITEDAIECGLGGFHVTTMTKEGPKPYCWIGAAKLDSLGKVSCEIWWLQKDKMDTVEGPKIL
jgi:hypothetical protein